MKTLNWINRLVTTLLLIVMVVLILAMMHFVQKELASVGWHSVVSVGWVN